MSVSVLFECSLLSLYLQRERERSAEGYMPMNSKEKIFRYQAVLAWKSQNVKSTLRHPPRTMLVRFCKLRHSYNNKI